MRFFKHKKISFELTYDCGCVLEALTGYDKDTNKEITDSEVEVNAEVVTNKFIFCKRHYKEIREKAMSIIKSQINLDDSTTYTRTKR